MKTIFITGAYSGIGRATAKYFAAKGWNVVASMRNPDEEKELLTLKNIPLLRLDVQTKNRLNKLLQRQLSNLNQSMLW